MRSKLESKISVTFFLKKISTKSEVKRKAVYATIAFKGTSAKLSTGIKCDNPEKDWKAGMFEGKNFTDENHKLLSIRREIESLDSRFFRSANHIKDVFNGAENNDLPTTILEVIDESYLERKGEVESATYKAYLTAINCFKKWIKEKRKPNFSIYQNHPQKITKRDVKNFLKWILTTKIVRAHSKKHNQPLSRVTANRYLACLSALYNVFYSDNADDHDEIVFNPFSKIRAKQKKHELVSNALERELDWKWIEKIEKVKVELPDGVVVSEKDFSQMVKHGSSLTELEKTVLAEKFRLLSLILANTGLSFAELGKEDVFHIQRSITGPLLAGRRVKTKEKYTIPVTPELEALIKEMGTLPWKPFVTNHQISDEKVKDKAYRNYYTYLNNKLAADIGYDEDETLSPHRFRHSFAMRMLNKCRFSLHVVARMLGDSEKTVRENYADYDDETITEVFNEEMSRYLKSNNNDDKSEAEVAV